GVREPDDLVALVVVAEDEQPVAEGLLGRGDAGGQVVGRRGGVPLGERGLEPKHVVWTSMGWLRLADGGDSPVASPTVMSSPEPKCSRSTGPAWGEVYGGGTGVRGLYPRLRGATSAGRHDPRRPRLLPVQGPRGAGHLRGQGALAPPAPGQLLPVAAQPAAAHRRHGGGRRDRRVDP